MSSEIVWLASAARDLTRLKNFIKSENPLAAQRAASRILEGVKILQQNPEAGVPVVDLIDYRDLMLSFGAGEYVIRYRRETANRVVIAQVRHSKEAGDCKFFCVSGGLSQRYSVTEQDHKLAHRLFPISYRHSPLLSDLMQG